MKDIDAISRDRERARRMLLTLASCNSGRRKRRLARLFVNWAETTSSCCFAAEEVENAYLGFAEGIRMPTNVPCRPRSCLVVMTHAYAFGGHTRWVERWIECDTSRSYSLVLTEDTADSVPESLRSLISARSGRIVSLLSFKGLHDKGQELRRLSLDFESILAAPHMDDPIPIVAYGAKAFPRPVAFMNHGNHIFWLGISIADAILETGYWQKDFSERIRGSNVSQVVYLPHSLSNRTSQVDKATARRRLGLPEKAKIVLSAGSIYKFRPCEGRDIRNVIRGVLADDEVEFCLVANQSPDFRKWLDPDGRYDRRLHLSENIPHDEFLLWCRAADVLVDSLPFTGGGVMGDACECGCPCVTLAKTVINPFMPLVRCDTVGEIVARTRILLNDRTLAKAVVDACHAFRAQMLDPAARASDVNRFMDGLASQPHAIHPFKPKFSTIDDNDVQILATRFNRGKNRRLFRRFVRTAPLAFVWAAVRGMLSR